MDKHSKYQYPVTFVRGKSTDDEAASWISTREEKPNIVLDGNEIKNFYESVINEEATTSKKHHKNKVTSVRKKTSKPPKPETTKMASDRIHAQFLKYAQEGELKLLTKCLDSGVDINFTDRFGWNALMCSSHGGHLSVVKYLIQRGIEHNVLDNTGNSAKDIAIAAKQTPVRRYLERMTCRSMHEKDEDEIVSKKLESFYCPECKKKFSETTFEAHKTSTLHLLNTKTEMPATLYHLPESNVGFKLMVKSGWDKDHGLGPSGEGKKFPVKTVLKRDRGGLGTDHVHKAKVTHFSANDQSAIVRQVKPLKRVESARTVSKKQRKAALTKKAKWERNLRQYMNSDF